MTHTLDIGRIFCSIEFPLLDTGKIQKATLYLYHYDKIDYETKCDCTEGEIAGGARSLRLGPVPNQGEEPLTLTELEYKGIDLFVFNEINRQENWLADVRDRSGLFKHNGGY